MSALSTIAEESTRKLTRVALVGVLVQIALGQLEGVLGNDLVQGEFSSAHELAGATVAQNVFLGVDVGGPGSWSWSVTTRSGLKMVYIL